MKKLESKNLKIIHGKHAQYPTHADCQDYVLPTALCGARIIVPTAQGTSNDRFC